VLFAVDVVEEIDRVFHHTIAHIAVVPEKGSSIFNINIRLVCTSTAWNKSYWQLRNQIYFHSTYKCRKEISTLRFCLRFFCTLHCTPPIFLVFEKERTLLAEMKVSF
jgi:hypothetical protein